VDSCSGGLKWPVENVSYAQERGLNCETDLIEELDVVENETSTATLITICILPGGQMLERCLETDVVKCRGAR
jgi:hypothetical protein